MHDDISYILTRMIIAHILYDNIRYALNKDCNIIFFLLLLLYKYVCKYILNINFEYKVLSTIFNAIMIYEKYIK